MLWEEMIASPLSEKLLYTCLVICFSGIASYYYQHMIHLPFNKDIAFVSTLIGCGILIFLLIVSVWSLLLSILASLTGGIVFSHRAT